MKWLLGLLLAAFVILGCEEDKETPVEIELVSAPTRLPYAEDQFHSNGWDTSEVRFVVRLTGDIGGVDTVICGIYDDLGSKVDSFHLFDDGNQEYHWTNTNCEDERTNDSEAGDGLYTRMIRPARVITNYSGAQYQFRFKAMKGNSSVATAEHWAESWAPTYTFTNIELEPNIIPPCSDSLRVTLKLTRDSSDYVENVSLGFPGMFGGLHSVLGQFTALSGDSVWRVAVAYNDYTWADFDYGDLVVGVHGRLGILRTTELSPYYTIRTPEVSLDATADSFHVSATMTADTFWVKANVVLCSGQNPDRVSTELLYFNVPSHWSLTYARTELNDCGQYGDEVAHDGIHTTYVLLVADAFAREFVTNIQLQSGATLVPDPCNWWPDRINTRVNTKLITFLPPQ